MPWDFTTDPEFAKTLDWVEEFVREEIDPLSFVIKDWRDFDDPVRMELIPPLQQIVKDKGLFSAHAPKAYGGAEFTELQLALLNERVGASPIAPVIFGCQSPDLGNAEIISHYGTEEQKEKYLRPLLEGRLVTTFAVTEPQGGADPKVFETHAELDGDMWVLNGEKWFASNAVKAAFLIVLAVTEPDNAPYQRMSAFFVERGTPGMNVVRDVGAGGHEGGGHAYLRFEDCRVPRENMLGGRGEAFVVMQTRMGAARLALATRSLGGLKRAIDQMCERANSRTTQGELLSRKQLVQEMIAESYMEYQKFRLYVMYTAWKLDQHGRDSKAVRADISALKVLLPRISMTIYHRAAQIHGSLGVSNELPYVSQVNGAMMLGVADGPTEVHKATLARQLLAQVPPAEGLFPTYTIPHQRELALKKYADVLARHGRIEAELVAELS
jgi:acyl-CoA dehydrogenase